MQLQDGTLMATSMQHFSQPPPTALNIFPGQPPVVEAVSTPLLPCPEMSSDVAKLLIKARGSWLKGNELMQLLEQGVAGKFPLSAAAADMPPSGSLFLYDRKKVRFFRLDGHNWRKKHDGKTVRETHEKLKVDNVDKLNCYYAHALEPFNLQRRCYWLLDNDKFVLVHYLETGFGTKRAANRWNELVQQQPEMSMMADTDAEGRPMMPAPGASTSMMQRRRCSLDSSKMSEGMHTVGRAGRVSLEETSRRHSSMEDSRDTYVVATSAWQPAVHPQMMRLNPWNPAGQFGAMHWQQTEATGYEHMLPWGSVPHSASALHMPKVPEHAQQDHQPQEFLSFHHAQPTMSAQNHSHHGMDVDPKQHSGSTHTMTARRPSLDDSAVSQQVGAPIFSVCEVSPQVVSVQGGDKVLVVGSGCELNSGVYIEVDGVRCTSQVVHAGVIGFYTRPHPKGLARIVIFSASGNTISSTAALEFAEPMLSMPAMPSHPTS
eukprot:jgi/Tetstr1/464638/TSEL_009392.t1